MGDHCGNVYGKESKFDMLAESETKLKGKGECVHRRMLHVSRRRGGNVMGLL